MTDSALLPTVVLLLMLVVIAAVPTGRDPELEAPVLQRERVADRRATQRDAATVARKRGAGRKLVAALVAIVRGVARVARRRAVLAASVVGSVAMCAMVQDSTAWAGGVGALTLGLLAGRALTLRRGVPRAELGAIPPTRTSLRNAVRLWTGRLGRKPRACLIIAAVIVASPIASYVPVPAARAVVQLFLLSAVVVVARWADRPIRQHLVDDQFRQRAELAFCEQLAAAAGCKPIDISLHATSTLDHRIVLLPGGAHARLRDDLDGALVKVGLEQWEGELSTTPNPQTGGSDIWLTLVPASAGTVERRRLTASSGGFVVAVSDPDEKHRRALTLAPGISPARAEQVSVWAWENLGADLVQWEPHAQRAATQVLTPAVRAVRDRLSRLMKVEPHRLNVDVEEGADHLERVVIRQAPDLHTDPARRHELWQQLVLSLPGGTNGWRVEEDAAAAEVTLTWGPARALPTAVPLADLLERGAWSTIPLGLGEAGTSPVGIDLTLGPHALYVGPTGSGKTVALLADAAQRLARGHDLVVVDPTKGGVDFASVLPYTRGAAQTMDEAVSLLEAVYAEGVRRKGVLKRHSEVKWSDLPADVRDAEDIRPLSVLIDELGSLLIAPSVPRALDKDDPRRVELEELAAQKAGLQITIGNIAREMRFVGIHLLLALQRPDAAVLSGELRSNLTSVVQLTKPGSPPSLDALRMIFSGDVPQEALDTLKALDDGRTRGLAVTAGDGGGLAGLRVAYAPMRDVPKLLEAVGVTPTNRPPLAAPSTSTARPQFGRIIDESHDGDDDEETVIDVDAAGIDLTGIDWDAVADDTDPDPDPWAEAAAARSAVTVDDLFGKPIEKFSADLEPRRTYVGEEDFDTPLTPISEEDRF